MVHVWYICEKFALRPQLFLSFSTYIHLWPIFICPICTKCRQWLCDTAFTGSAGVSRSSLVATLSIMKMGRTIAVHAVSETWSWKQLSDAVRRCPYATQEPCRLLISSCLTVRLQQGGHTYHLNRTNKILPLSAGFGRIENITNQFLFNPLQFVPRTNPSSPTPEPQFS